MLPSEVEALALRYVPGEGGVALEPLGLGLVNESYRVARGGRRYALRVAVPNALQLGLDRAWECRVLERAMASGIAPLIECCEPRCGILVARWVDGCAWTVEQVRRAENIERIAELARRIHALVVPAAARRMSPASWIAHYRDALIRYGVEAHHPLAGGRRLLDLQSALEERLTALAKLPPVESVLCHSDLHAQNLIASDQGLIVLDWEYAHVAEPFWDLAGWVGNNDLSADSSRLLLKAYLGRQPEPADETRLNLLGWLYDYICWMWGELYLKLRADSAAGGMWARAQCLTARLQREPGGGAG
jgi:thiamine kinase